ncbi:MAG: SDR family oxidoreductase [Armatimonadetes bacterium]|nr:SDR family oxidoreductase [Armatimonadota bacterium]
MTSRRVLVTGSSRGIGRAIATKLAMEGWDIALHASTDSDELHSIVKELGKRAKGAYATDLSEPDNATKLFEQALGDGEIHALVNNAGIYMPMELLKTTDTVFKANVHRTLGVNFLSPLYLARAAAKHFSKKGSGRILNVASRVGFRGEPGASIYAASKAALINLTRSMAVELAPHKIGVFGIAPGWVDTAMAREGMEERLSTILEGIPLGRMATPADCAAAAAFLVSDEASYLSGVVIDINGASYFH